MRVADVFRFGINQMEVISGLENRTDVNSSIVRDKMPNLRADDFFYSVLGNRGRFRLGFIRSNRPSDTPVEKVENGQGSPPGEQVEMPQIGWKNTLLNRPPITSRKTCSPQTAACGPIRRSSASARC